MADGLRDLVQDFCAALNKFSIEKDEKIAVAVSGGPDSVALMLMLHEAGFAPYVLCVDHGLRAESAQGARQVCEWAQALGFECFILKSAHAKIDKNIQSNARDLRYGLMTKKGQAIGVKKILLAQHVDDLVENFFIRLSRGSGVDGLAAMDEVNEVNSISILRPLMEFSKADLVEFCKQSSIYQ